MKSTRHISTFKRKSNAMKSNVILSQKGNGGKPDAFFPKLLNNQVPSLVKVHLHTSPAAAALAQSLNAQAFTHKNHIFFNKGKYSPGTSEGKRLLAHELTHVNQQQNNPSLANTIQRYPVRGSLPCNDVVPWLNSNSPYKPEWAETKCEYSFNGSLSIKITDQKGGKVKMEVKGSPTLTVSVDCPIDSPEWSPTARPNLAAEEAAWSGMKTVLDGHEAAHRTIGEKHRVIMEKKYQAVNFTKTGKDQADAQAQVEKKVFGDQKTWIAAAQAAQSKIDPFRGANLACPAPTPTNP